MVPCRAFPVDADDARIREPLESALAAWTRRYELTLAEIEILRLAALGTPRAALANQRGVMESTVKSQVKLLLDKTGDAKLDDATNRLLRTALLFR